MNNADIRNTEDFERAAAGAPKLVLFHSRYCPFCRAFLPVFDKAAAEAPGSFAKVCTDELPDLEDRFSVEVVPTVLLFSGGRLQRRLDGRLGEGLTEAQLREFAASALGGFK